MHIHRKTTRKPGRQVAVFQCLANSWHAYCILGWDSTWVFCTFNQVAARLAPAVLDSLISHGPTGGVAMVRNPQEARTSSRCCTPWRTSLWPVDVWWLLVLCCHRSASKPSPTPGQPPFWVTLPGFAATGWTEHGSVSVLVLVWTFGSLSLQHSSTGTPRVLEHVRAAAAIFESVIRLHQVRFSDGHDLAGISHCAWWLCQERVGGLLVDAINLQAGLVCCWATF